MNTVPFDYRGADNPGRLFARAKLEEVLMPKIHYIAEGILGFPRLIKDLRLLHGEE